MQVTTSVKSIRTAGIFLGLGMGGFFDGIVLHQILQWHHLLTERYPADSVENLQLNTLADGLFHALTYVFTAVGLFLLWRTVRQRHIPVSGQALAGAMLLGWGVFNVVEGMINHHLLQLHHVRSGSNEVFWDVAFLMWGGAMLIGGWLLMRRAETAIT